MNVCINTCMFLLYSIGNKMCVAEDNRNVTFCETEDNIEINCPQNTTIAIQFLTTAQYTNNDECLRRFNLSLRDQCSGNSNCDVSAKESPLNNCRLIPKFLKVFYTCFCRFLVFPSKFSRVTEVSAADTSKISCDCTFTFRKMEINHVEPNEGSCKKCSINEVKISLSNLCKKERTCSSPQNDDSSSCLFHPRYARIYYSCQEEKNGTSILPEGTTELKLTTEPLNSNVSSTTSTVKEHTTRIYDYDTQETSTVTYGSTDSIETKAVVQLDMQGRVLIYDPDANKSVTVCGNHWYADDASVLCKYLHKSSYGIATKLLKHHLYTTVELKFQCTGNEMSLFDCNNTFIGINCNVSTVAAVICCPDDDSSECSSNTQPKSNAMPSTGLNIGVVIGIVLGVLLIACLVIVIVIFIRRSIGPKNKNEEQSSDMSIGRNDYTGTQDIAMPIACEHRPSNPGLEMETRDDQYHYISDINNDSNKNISDPSKYAKLNNKNKHVGDQRSHKDFAIPDQSNETVIISNSHTTVNKYVLLDPNETGFNRYDGPDKMNESNELTQPIHHIGHSKDTEWERKTLDDVYAHSEEGLYDSSNGNRHKVSESNVYSHAVDNVYDSSNHTRTNGETEDNYDHFTGKKTDDDYDISTI